MHPYPKAHFTVLYAFFLCMLPLLLPAQTIDLSKPVGTPLGASGVSGTGSSTYTVPIKLPSGTNSMQPEINLSYNSQGGDGIAGWGWNLSCISVIGRDGKNNYYNGITTPVKYDNTNDAFVMDGQRLFLTSGTNGAVGAVYGIENEQFAKIECVASSVPGGFSFRVTAKNGTVMEYGTDGSAHMPSNDGSGQNMLWFLNKITDINGNYIRFFYFVNPTDRSYSLSEIQYTGNANTGLAPYYRVVFSYNVRNEWSNTTIYSGGASLRNAFLLIGVAVHTGAANYIVKSYDFTHETVRGQYFLKTVTEKSYTGTAYNPLVFTYGSNTAAANVATSIQYPNMHKGNVYAGDFDGNGRQDVLQSNYYYDNNNIPHYTSYDVLSDFSSYNGQPAISFFYNYTIPQNGATEVKGTSNGYYNFLTYDYDGDSKEDVLMINSIVSGSDRIFNGISINYSRHYSVYSGPTYDAMSYPYIPHSFMYVQDFKYVYRSGSTFGSYFVPGDFDGDGAQDYILVLGINSSNAFKGFFSSPKKGIFNEEILQFGVEGTPTDQFYANSVASAKQLMPVDFDGDGKQEILVMKDNQSYILSVFPVSATTGYLYAAQVLHTIPGIKSNYPVFPGDFNGDGKTDLLHRASAIDENASWYILISTGKAYIAQSMGFANRVYLPGDGGGSAHHLMVSDLNGDGRSDILHSLDLSASTSRHSMYFSKGLSFVTESYDQPVSTNGSEQANTVIGDFNGDGKTDILGINNSSYGRFIYPRPFKEERFLTNVVNGLGAQEGFEYSVTTSGGVYSRSAGYEYDIPGTSVGYGINGNPYNVLSTPMYVVSNAYRSNGISSGLNYTSYQYTDAAFHRIRGFLGFKKLSITDGATGINSITENAIQHDFLVPHAVHQYSSLYGDLLSDTKITDTLLKVTTSWSDKRYVHQVLKTLALDNITGSATETNNTYDNYGNITQRVIKAGSLSGTTVTPVETSTTTTVYGTHGTPFPSSPDNVTVQNVRSGQAAVTKATTYAYNTRGLVTTKVEYAGLPKAITSTFAYDSYGNVTQTDITAAGLSTRTNKFTYDNSGKFLLKAEAYGTGIIKKTTTTYESLFGNPITKVSSDGLTATFGYDVFGRLTSTIVPEGYTITRTFAWETANGRYSINLTRPGGGRNVKTSYDILERPVREEASGFNNGTLISTKEYNYKGQEINSVAPYYSSETPVTVSTQYDNFGRITQVSNGATTTTNTYAKLSNAQFQVTTTIAAGQSSSKTQDAAGRIISSTDNGGTLNFTYDSRGNALQTILNGTTITSRTYDDYGNQISLTDKNAGTFSYAYDPLGQLISQTNPLNQTTSSSYDPLGRITTRTGPEGTTTYEYWSDLTTGYCNDKVKKVTGFAGELFEFTYDNLRRVQSEKTTVDGISFTMGYEYDAYSNPTKTSYSSGFSILRAFDHDGSVTSATMADGVPATTLFGTATMNSLGRYTSYYYGNGKQTVETYNHALGVLTQTNTPAVQNLSFNFDAQTGNLSSRKDIIRNLEEVFTYDNLNRLRTTSVNNVQQLSMNFDGTTSASLGNITSKTDAGNYVYNNAKINAVAYVTNPAGAQVPPAVISQQQQDITYTPFQKTATVTEGIHQLTYTYASDYERIKSVLKQSGVDIETKYYFGSYERQTRNGVTRELHYIPMGNGIGSIIVKQNGAFQVYYAYTDHLGSILTLTDAAGNLVASQNFDAWGRYRNPSDWTYNSVPAAPDWLYRGYTGHEHLREFVLVNMNGRMYDPILGRTMSPDNYVPTPWNTQGYNRYAYGLNNPLIYTDPDGQAIWAILIPILISALKGAAIASAVYVASNFIAGNTWKDLSFSQWARAAGAGALGGAFGGAFSLLGNSIGSFGQSITYGILQNVATQAAVDVAFGNRITFGSILGYAAGGALNGMIPQFKGIPFKKYNFGAAVINGFAELAVNTGRGAVIGGISSVIGGGNFEDGARSGAVGAFVNTSINLAILGPTIRPTGDVKQALQKMEKDLNIKLLGGHGPTYRAGGLWTRGLTVGRSAMINDGAGNVNDVGTWVHESYHYYQQLNQGWAGQFTNGIHEQWWLVPFKGVEVYNYHIHGQKYNESSAYYYEKVTYPKIP